MGVTITIGDAPEFNITSYSVTEDSTPIDPSDTTGGVGQFTFGIDEDDKSKFLSNKSAKLEDGSQGTTLGTIRGLSSPDGALTVTADSRMALLAVKRTAQPFIGTLEGAFVYYLGLVGIISGLVVDDSIASRPVVYQGWSGVVWDELKKLAVAERVEISLVSNNIVMRPLRQRKAEQYRDSSRTWNINSQNLARSVDIHYYSNQYKAVALAYPSGGWSPDVSVQGVDAGATTTVDVPLSVSLLSIDQPVCVDFVDRYYAASSVYTVSGNDGLPIPSAEWLAGGGSVTAAIGEDTKSVIFTITGSSDTQYAPYKIAMPSGPSDFYSSLRLVGEGVFFDDQVVTLLAAVDPDRVTQEQAPEVRNERITSLEQAQSLGLWSLKRWGSPSHTVTVASSGINRLGDTGSYRYPTIAEFNAEYAGLTVAQFNAIWAGKTIADFNEYWRAKTAGDFENQAFGNVVGSRFRLGDAMFRIRTATITAEGISYSAEEDTIIADVNAVWAGKTIADFNAEWAGQTLADFAVAPLRKAA